MTAPPQYLQPLKSETARQRDEAVMDLSLVGLVMLVAFPAAGFLDGLRTTMIVVVTLVAIVPVAVLIVYHLRRDVDREHWQNPNPPPGPSNWRYLLAFVGVFVCVGVGYLLFSQPKHDGTQFNEITAVARDAALTIDVPVGVRASQTASLPIALRQSASTSQRTPDLHEPGLKIGPTVTLQNGFSWQVRGDTGEYKPLVELGSRFFQQGALVKISGTRQPSGARIDKLEELIQLAPSSVTTSMVILDNIGLTDVVVASLAAVGAVSGFLIALLSFISKR